MRRRGRAVPLGSMVVMTVACAIAAPLIARWWGADAAYWASPARAGEILVGATLAVALHAGRIHPTRWMAPVGLVGVIALGVALPATGGPAYQGWMTPLALVSGLLIVGLQRPGPVRQLLGSRPFAVTGRVSYGLYLYHFPVFVALDEHRLGFGGVGLFVIRI
ncbi:MAG TPA: hypothetical protein PLV68_01415, partial [Ilumatobacteraceae bacterium]|nr:hypothetical protein [Ilumatobacteraceae bacterium]